MKIDNTFPSNSATRQAGLAKLWAVLAVVFVLVAGGLYLGASKWLLGAGEDASLADVERAVFASQKPNAAAYVNLAQMRALLEFSGDDALEEKASNAMSSMPMLESLGNSDVLFDSSSYALFAARLAEKQAGAKNDDWLAVIHGDYAQLDVKAELAQRYELKPASGESFLLEAKPISLEGDVDFECPKDTKSNELKAASQLYGHFSDEQLIFSSSTDSIAAYLNAESATDSDAATQSGLSAWKKYRSDSLVSVTLLDKEALPQDFLTRAASEGLLAGAEYQYIGARVSLDVSKQSLEASFDAMIDDVAKVKEVAASIKSNINDLSANNKDAFPSVTDLLSRIDVSSNQGLHLSLQLDKAVFGELENLFSDFMSMIFSVDSTQDQPSSDAAPEEVLEKHTWDYALNDQVFQVVAPKKDSFSKFAPLLSQSGVSIYMDSIGIKAISAFDKEQGDALQLAIKAKRPADFGDAFFSWSDSGIEQSLHIQEVLSQSGQNLLKDERCNESRFGQNLNHQPDTSSNYSNGVIETTKNVRLVDNADVASIASLSGEYALKAPINISTKDLNMSSPGHTWSGGVFKLTSNKHGSVSYVLSDENALLIDVLGLNAKGQALSQQMSFSSGKKYTKQFKGEVTSVRLVLAGEFKQERFKFKVDKVIPDLSAEESAKAAGVTAADPAVVSASELALLANELSFDSMNEEELDAVKSKISWDGYTFDGSEPSELGHTNVGAAALFFKHDLESSWSNQLKIKVLLPHLAVLSSSDNLLAAKLVLDGKPVEPNFVTMNKVTSNGQVVPLIKAGRLALDAGSLSIDLDKEQGQIKQIEGVLEYRLPTKIAKQSVDLNASNQRVLSENFNFLEYAFTWQGSTRYRLDGELANAHLIRLTSSDGSQQFGKIARDNDSVTITFDGVKKAVAIDVFTLEETQLVSEEFKFTPNYSK